MVGGWMYAHGGMRINPRMYCFQIPRSWLVVAENDTGLRLRISGFDTQICAYTSDDRQHGFKMLPVQ